MALKEFQNLCLNYIAVIATDNPMVSVCIKGGEIGPSLCPLAENPDLVYQKQVTQSLTHPRLAECDHRQAIQARTDHSNRIVPPSKVFKQYTAGGTSLKWTFCHQVQQQLYLCLTSSRSTSPGSRGPQSTLGGSGPTCLPTSSRLGQVMEKLQDHPCNRLLLIAPGWSNMPWFWDLVTMSSQIPLCLHFLPDLWLSYSTRPFKGTW